MTADRTLSTRRLAREPRAKRTGILPSSFSNARCGHKTVSGPRHQDPFGACLVLVHATAPANSVGHVGGPNTSLAGGLPGEETHLPPSRPASACRILKPTQDCVEKCFPFQYANKKKIVSMDVRGDRILSAAEPSNEPFCNEGHFRSRL